MSKEYKKFILLLIIVFFIFSIIPSSFASEITDTDMIGDTVVDANSIYVSSTGNDTTGDGSQTSPFSSISKAVESYDESTNSNIFIFNGTYLINEKIIVEKDVIFIGESNTGVILDGNNESSLFDVDSKKVSFYNLSFVNGGVDDAAIKVDVYDLVVDNCIFDNNNAGAITSTGGFMDWYSANLKISNSVFSNNVKYSGSYGMGGAAISAGAIYSSLTVTNCTFINNTASPSGGAIAIGNTRKNTIISNSRFINNTAQQGSAVYMSNGYDLTVKNSEFKYNNASEEGCVIYHSGSEVYPSTISLGFNTFTDNYPQKEMIIEDYANIIYLDKNDRLTGSDIDMNVGDNEKFTVSLTDSEGNPISGKKITVTLTDYFKKAYTYNVFTDDAGNAILYLINQSAGTYSVVSAFEGDSVYDPVNCSNIIKIKAEHSYNIVFNESIVKVKAGESHIVTATVCGEYLTPVVVFNTYNIAWINHYGGATYSTGHTFSGSTFIVDVIDFELSTQKDYYYINFTAYTENVESRAYGTLIVDTSIPLPPVSEDIDVIYVDQKIGSDETGDGTESNPLATVNVALYVNEVFGGNKTIFVKEGIYNISNLEIYANVSVIGEKGKTIFRQSAGDEGMLILDNRVTTRFTNITFIDGYAVEYSVYIPVILIRNENSVSYFNGCEFYNNTGSSYGIIFIAYGGTGYFDNCIFGDNVAKTFDPAGAIIVLQGNLYVNNSVFYNNTASEGGAIHVSHNSHADIYNSLFYRNVALNDTAALAGGGAIFVNNDVVTIYNCSFIENYAELNGGAIYLLAGDIEVQKSLFENNRVGPGSSKGSAIASDSGYEVGVYIDHSILTSDDGSRLIFVTALNDDSETVTDDNYWGSNYHSGDDNWAVIKTTLSSDKVYKDDSVEVTVEFVGAKSDLIHSIHDYALNLTTELGSVDTDSIVIVDNVAKFNYYATAVGDETIDMIHGQSRYKLTFEVEESLVDKKDVNANVSINDDNTAVIIELPDDLSNNITITVDDNKYSIKANGSLSYPISLMPGNHTISVTYPGDDNYKLFISDVINVNIDKYDADLIISVDDAAIGEDLIVNVSANSNLTAEVKVSINNKTYTVKLSNGFGTTTVTDVLDVGDYVAVATFDGNDYFLNDTANDTFSISGSSIDIIYVSQVNGSDTDGNGSMDNPYATISKALDRNKRLGGNKIIVVYDGNYTLNRYSITDNVTVVGYDNVFISANNTNHIFIGGNVNVTLFNLNFINGNGITAGSIDMGNDDSGNIGKELTIIMCNFINNTGSVGAISTYANTTILESTFINNTATGRSGYNQGLISIQDNTINLAYNIFLNNKVSGDLIVSSVDGKANTNFFGSNDKPAGISNKLELDSWVVIVPEIDDDVRTKTNYDLKLEFMETNDGINFTSLNESMPDLAVNLVPEVGTVTPNSTIISDNEAVVDYIIFKKGSELINVNIGDKNVVNLTFDVDVPEYDKIYVSLNGSDNNTGSRDAPLATIKQALAQNKANGGDKTIIVLPGVYDEHDLLIDTPVVIIGDNATIKSDNDLVIFAISADATIDNLTLTNGNVAIEHNGGDLTIINSVFENNEGSIVSSGNLTVSNTIFSKNNGYAIYSNGDANIENCEFSENNASDVYGLVYIIGNSNITNSTFMNNDVGDASAVYIEYGDAVIKDNVFDSNTNAIAANNVNADISDNAFSGDSVKYVNSEITSQNNTNAKIVIDNSTITNTVVKFLNNSTVIEKDGIIKLNASVTDDSGNIIDGGEIIFTSEGIEIGKATVKDGIASLDYAFDTGNYDISGSFGADENATVFDGLLRINVAYFWFIDETGYETLAEAVEAAELGDVIKGVPGTYDIDRLAIGHRYFSLEPWEVIKSITITSLNETPVTLKGHGNQLFFIDVGSELTLKNIILRDAGSFDEFGGAIETLYNANLTVINCTFINNTAENGGAIYATCNLTIINSTFDNNEALTGGAVYVSSKGDVSLENVIFSNNYAPYGGAFFNDLSKIDLDNIKFINNTAFVGGAVYTRGGLFKINNSEFISNAAVVNEGDTGSSLGGAVHDMLSDAYFINTKFINNHADDLGGAMELENGYYGGIYWVTIDNCTFANNTAQEGGAIYMGEYYDPYVNITSSLFESNTAELSAAAISVNFGHVTIEDTEFNNNKNTYGTDLISIEGDLIESVEFNSYLTVIDSSFKNNDVDYDFYLVNEYSVLDLYNSEFDGENTIVYNRGNAQLFDNVANNTSEYVVENYGNLGLENNIFDKVILNKNVITTLTWIVVLNNESVIAIEGENFQLTAVITDDNGNLIETGNLTFIVDSKNIDAIYEDGEFKADYMVTSGNHTVSASCSDEGLQDLFIKPGLIVTKLGPEINISVNTPTMGEDAIINIEISPDTYGNVTVNVNGKSYNVAINNGHANLTVPGLNAGTYKVEVSYPGDENYGPSKAVANLEVLRLSNYTMETNISDITEGENLTVIVTLPEDATGMVSVKVGDSVKYASVKNGVATITVPDLDEGTYNVTVTYLGNGIYAPREIKESFVVKESNKIQIIAEDVEKYFGGPERFVVKVVNAETGEALANVKVIITINGVDYTRTTNENGTASMALNIPSGVYNITVKVNDTIANSTVTIKATVNGTDLVKVFRNATQYYATFRDSQGNYLPEGTEVEFNINGVFYTRKVTANGMAKLNINLEQGEYIITAINPLTQEKASNLITVIPRIIENHDLVKYYRNASQYTVKIIGDDGKAVSAGVEVTFNINGVFYTRTTNASGIAKLNINLDAGDYIITAEYNNCKVSNNITVKPILSAEDVSMSYRDGTQFEAKLVDGQGNPYRGQSVSFNINGVFYTRTTDADGIARLNINLMSGEYIITSTYNGFNIANKITIA